MTIHRHSNKRPVIFLFCIIVLVLLASCGADADDYNDNDQISEGDYVSYANQTYAGNGNDYDNDNDRNDDYVLTQPIHLPFTGDTTAYEFLWSDTRDRHWEEDIIYFADTLLRRHPLLISGTGAVSVRGAFDLTNFQPTIRLTRGSEHFDEELKAEFLKQINDLINRVPDLEDLEIVMGLSRITALIGDSHTSITPVLPPIEDIRFLPIHFTVSFEEGHPGGLGQIPNVVHIWGAFDEFESLINTRLLAINGIYTEELIERLRAISPYENEETLHNGAATLMIKNVLKYLDISDNNETAILTVKDIDGVILDAEVPFVGSTDISGRLLFFERDVLYQSRPDENFWFEYFPEESLMYVRISAWRDMPGMTSSAFLVNLISTITEKQRIETFVLDQRGNGGGVGSLIFFQLIRLVYENRDLIGSIYIAVDHGTASAAVDSTYLLYNAIEDSILIGSPSAGEPYMFGDMLWGVLPNSGVMFTFGTGATFSPDQTPSQLIPDILIYRTLDDFINNRDAVMEYIRRM